MINLLPPDYALRIRFGRANARLRGWIAMALLAVAGLIVILAGGWLYLNSQTESLKKQLEATNQQLKNQNFEKVQKEAKEITGDITVIDKILNQEVQFSELIKTMGADMPPGAVLTELSLDNKVNGALSLTVNSIDYASAAQVAVNLSDPKNQLFSKVDVLDVSCNDAVKTGQVYKCDSRYTALFSQDAKKKFLGPPGSGR